MSMMRVGINALHLRWGINAGTETYFTEIVRPWYDESPMGGVDFVVLCQSRPPWGRKDRPHFRFRPVGRFKRPLQRILWDQIWVPRVAATDFDVLFQPGYVGALASRVPQVVTVHDAFAWVHPQVIGWARAFYWRWFVPLGIRLCARVIAVSESTAKDLQTYLMVPPGKVVTIHEGGDRLDGVDSDLSIRSQLSLELGRFFLCVGVFKDIKNPWRILSAYLAYREVARAEALPLVCTGIVVGRRARRIERAARAIPGVRLAGRVSDSALAALYRSATALVFPSLYEGFGIPILEAQSLGCPVITSSVSSMPEVAGSGALLVNPLDEGAISDALLHLHRPETRERLIALGRRNRKRFSWGEASKETWRLLLEVAQNG